MTDPLAVPAAPAEPLAPAVPAAPPRRRNTVGIVAFSFGALAFFSPVIGVIVGFALSGELPNADGWNFANVFFFATFGAGAGCVIAPIAIVLGFVSLAVKNAKRLWGILGLVLGVIAVIVGWLPLVTYIFTISDAVANGVPFNG